MRESCFGQRKCSFPHLCSHRTHTFELEQSFAVGREELEPFHLRPTLWPAFITARKPFSPLPPANIVTLLESIVDRRFRSQEAKCSPAGGSIICAQGLGINLPTSQNTDGFPRHTGIQ